MATAERAFYLNELKSDQCQCGRNKKSGRSLCYTCFMSLPEDLRRALYRDILGGYPEAYEAAVKWLTEQEES